MEFLSRLLGASYTPRKAAPKVGNDAQSRLARYNRILSSISQLCNNQRDLARERATLDELQILFDRLTQVIRDESRAVQPHPCVQNAVSNQVYALVNRAASISFHAGCIHSAVALMSALVDSEEESFLTNRGFAKSLTRLVTKVMDNDEIELPPETESIILELLFTISAKIRLQPEILPSWFTLTRRQELDLQEEKGRAGFGLTRAQDFPLCVILVDRIYKEGRTGDFARTALLYLFEATTKSSDLAVYMMESSICTLMASGLGALYSQLSRELSILHPDAVLPPVLAMSDYSTRPTQTSAESAFNESHIAHMSTFISYLFFWVDILDHVRRSDVKQALLDNFEILFLQQLLYPSILQSSDIDAGSAIAILTYIDAMLSGIEHPELVDTILSYVLAIDRSIDRTAAKDDDQQEAGKLQRRESLLSMTQSGHLEDMVEPKLFTLADLIQNSLDSANSQTLFAALRLSATIIRRQSAYAIGTLLTVTPLSASLPKRSLGVVRAELEQYMALAARIQSNGLEAAFSNVLDDRRLHVEANEKFVVQDPFPEQYMLSFATSTFLTKLMALLRDFFTNPAEVNLALTQAVIAIASLPQIRLDGWICLSPQDLNSSDTPLPSRSWQHHLDPDEVEAFKGVQRVSLRPTWPQDDAPRLYDVLLALANEFETVRASVSNLDALLSARKLMLQIPGVDVASHGAVSLPVTPVTTRRTPFSGNEAQTSSTLTAIGEASQADTGKDQSQQLQGGTDETQASDLTASPDINNTSPTQHEPVLPHRPDGTPTQDSSRLTAHRIFRPPPAEMPSTTDVLMRRFEFEHSGQQNPRSATLNHVLTNTVILQEFVLEIAAIIQVRASMFAEREVLVS